MGDHFVTVVLVKMKSGPGTINTMVGDRFYDQGLAKEAAERDWDEGGRKHAQ
jgi:hypothetical protein